MPPLVNEERKESSPQKFKNDSHKLHQILIN